MSAAAPSHAYALSQPNAWINVWDYFLMSDLTAIGGASWDAALMINRAIADGAATYPQGCVIYLPPGIYPLGSGIVIAANNITLRGDGWTTILKPASGTTFDMIATGVIPTGANAANNLQGIVIEDMAFDGSLALANVAGTGNAIHFWGARQSFVRRCKFSNIKNYCVLMEGSLAGNGYNDVVEYCLMDSNCAGGVMTANSNEANWILFNELIGCAQTLAAPQPMFGSQSTAGNCINHQAGISLTMGNVFGGGASGGTMNAAVILNNEGHRFMFNRFDNVMNIGVDIWGSGSNSGIMIIGNEFKATNTVVAGPSLRVDAGYVSIIGNSWVSDLAANYTYNIAELSHALTGCVYLSNQFRVPGTTGRISLNAGSTSVAAHNTGYNPRGNIAAPAIPASTVAYTNVLGVDCMVHITGGTVTAIAIGGTATGLTSGSFRVPAGQSIAITYSVAPTWSWFGD